MVIGLNCIISIYTPDFTAQCHNLVHLQYRENMFISQETGHFPPFIMYFYMK